MANLQNDTAQTYASHLRKNAGVLAGACVFAAIGILMAGDHAAPWWWTAFWVICLLALLCPPRSMPRVDELEISAAGLLRRFGRGGDANGEERLRWDEIQAITVETTDGGPFAEDMYFILHGCAGNGMVVTNDLACRMELLNALQAHFPDLDNHALIDAAGCTENRSFLLWRRTAPDAAPAGETR